MKFTFFYQVRPGEPVYAQVNRDRKNKNGKSPNNPHLQDHPTHQQMLQQQQHHQQQLANAGYSDYTDHAEHWHQHQQSVTGNGSASIVDGSGGVAGSGSGQAGDSWV